MIDTHLPDLKMLVLKTVMILLWQGCSPLSPTGAYAYGFRYLMIPENPIPISDHVMAMVNAYMVHTY